MNDLFRLSPFLFHIVYIAHRVAFCLTQHFYAPVENSYTLIYTRARGRMPHQDLFFKQAGMA